VISAETRPRLATKARLRFDRTASRFMLLYPERGLVLNGTAADVLTRCNGELTVGAIAEELARKYDREPPAVTEEVLSFLRAMADRGLVQPAP
jgi:pyrroloquinoline quinone biosynthesis protein D